MSESTLDIAARSLLASQAISGTVAGVVLDRAFDHAFDGLFHHAVIRVGVERANELMVALVERHARASRAELEANRTPRATLYVWLREAFAKSDSSRLSSASPLWWQAHGERPDRFAALRDAITDSDADIVELRFARGLDEDEVASVLSRTIEQVRDALSKATSASIALFGKQPRSYDRSHEGALLEAYSLDPHEVTTPRRSLRKPALESGTIVADRYDIEGLLGAGAFADVYRARDREVTGHVVALKLLRTRSSDARSIRAALRELQHLASVFHPSIVQLKDHGWHDGRLWFVMPLYSGETLATRLERGPLERAEARRIFEMLAEALATMHRAGVRHQDVKPENVFLAKLDGAEDGGETDGKVLPILLDLGVAAKDAELVLAGTPAYFAPEVAARFARVPDPPPVGPKADVFSLALTLRQALSPSTEEPVPRSAVERFIAFRALHPPTMPTAKDLADLRPQFARWLATSPDDRPNAEEFHRELAALTEVEERKARRRATLRWAMPLAAAAVAFFLAVVAELKREAADSRAEAMRAGEQAEQARDREQLISQSLDEQSARSERLESDVARLEDEYQRSRMTREQLASRLARSEGELDVLTDRERTHLLRHRQLTESHASLEAERARLASSLGSAEERVSSLGDALSRERTRVAEATSAAETMESELEATRNALDLALSRVNALETRVATSERGLHELRSPAPTTSTTVTE